MPCGEAASGAARLDRAAAVLRVLAAVPDPEIPVIAVTELGVVREFREGNPATLVITPTYSGCPAALAIGRAIRVALDQAGFDDVVIRTELAPAWTTDWISEAGRDKLRAYGIAPPATAAERGTAQGASVVPCPRCASRDTTEISRFGSTPCKALWRCLDCAEPFDRFKCL